jgi:hypothetical protein
MPPTLPHPSRTTCMSPCGQVAQPLPEPCLSSQTISFSSCRAHAASPSLKLSVPTTPRTPSACAASSLPYFISPVASTPFTPDAPMPQPRPSVHPRPFPGPCVACSRTVRHGSLRGSLCGLPGVACATCPRQPRRSLCG